MVARLVCHAQGCNFSLALNSRKVMLSGTSSRLGFYALPLIRMPGPLVLSTPPSKCKYPCSDLLCLHGCLQLGVWLQTGFSDHGHFRSTFRGHPGGKTWEDPTQQRRHTKASRCSLQRLFGARCWRAMVRRARETPAQAWRLMKGSKHV
jgi:hypothetical protein